MIQDNRFEIERPESDSRRKEEEKCGGSYWCSKMCAVDQWITW